MRKNLISTTAVVIFAVFSMGTYAYGINLGEIYKEENYTDIIALEDTIISDLYNSSLGESGDNGEEHTSSIDFNKAQKAYVFTPNDFLNSMVKDDFGKTYTEKGQLVWRVPVEISSDTYDYAIIGQGDDGKYNYTTVRTPKENIDSVRYLFDPAGIMDEMKASIGNGLVLYIVSVPMYGIDLLVLENSSGLSFIPLSSQSEELKFGQVYSKDNIAEKMENIISYNTTSADAGGAAGGSNETSKEEGNMLIPLAAVTLLVTFLFLWQLKKTKRTK